jgi:opacity protein-like surface antigen
MPSRAALAATALLLAFAPARASADATGFIGLVTEPSVRPALGFSLGAGLLIVGFEFEYAQSGDDLDDLAPSLRTFMGNLLIQTPVPIGGVQFYGTVGAGAYREQFDEVFAESEGLSRDRETNVGTNLGGGVKIGLAGPLRLRLDYRVFILNDSITGENQHRLYAGVNLRF